MQEPPVVCSAVRACVRLWLVRVRLCECVCAGGVEYVSIFVSVVGLEEVCQGAAPLRLRRHVCVIYPSPPPPHTHNSDRLAARFGVTRKEQDEFAVRSHHLAAKAHKDGLLADEIIPVNGNKDDNGIRADSSYEKLSTLKVCTGRGLID